MTGVGLYIRMQARNDMTFYLFQVAQLNRAEEALSSPAETPEDAALGPSSSSAEPTGSMSIPDKETLDEPKESERESPSSSSPIDLSTKKSPESVTNTETDAEALTDPTAGQGRGPSSASSSLQR